MKCYAIVGSSGFIGSAVLRRFVELNASCSTGFESFEVLSISRRAPCLHFPKVRYCESGDLSAFNDWAPMLRGVDLLVHAAARVHVMSDTALDPLSEFQRVNVQGTLHLARQAAAAGVRRFIFISSVKVNGEATRPGAPFSPDGTVAPQDPYGISKMEAEQGLRQIAADTSMEVVIIRPPLVYGPAVKANFASLMRAVQRGLPLPFALVRNQRSLLGIDNLVDFIVTCTSHPKAANQTFLVSDGQDLSTPELIHQMAKAAGMPARLLPVPVWALQASARLMGKGDAVQRLCWSLQVDMSKARELLGWVPPVSVEEGLRACFGSGMTSRTDALNRSSFVVTAWRGWLLRVLDVLLAGTGLLVLWPVLLLVCVLGWLDTRSPLFIQERVGRNQQPFVLIKFRTMRPGTASVASHLASSTSITRTGAFLRRTKLDELPQLWNVLRGHMSLVGPRPGLFNQNELTAAREALGVYAARPGITGLAQVNGIDMSTPELLAQTDANMLRELGVVNYFKFILLTVTGKGSGDGVKIK